MAKNNDSNKKLPKPPSSVTTEAPATDIEVRVSGDGRGFQVYSPYGDFAKANESSFKEEWTPQGSYQTDESHSKGELQTSLRKESRNYNTGGSASTVEGSREDYTKDTKKETVEGDRAVEVGRKEYHVVADQRIDSILGGEIKNTAGGTSSATTYTMSEGDVVEERSGGNFQSFEGDNVVSVKENNVLVVGSGDYAAHVQTGNWDTHIAQKARLYADNDILIESKTKITLKVGTSTIVITPNDITVIAKNKSGFINLN